MSNQNLTPQKIRSIIFMFRGKAAAQTTMLNPTLPRNALPVIADLRHEGLLDEQITIIMDCIMQIAQDLNFKHVHYDMRHEVPLGIVDGTGINVITKNSRHKFFNKFIPQLELALQSHPDLLRTNLETSQEIFEKEGTEHVLPGYDMC